MSRPLPIIRKVKLNLIAITCTKIVWKVIRPFSSSRTYNYIYRQLPTVDVITKIPNLMRITDIWFAGQKILSVQICSTNKICFPFSNIRSCGGNFLLQIRFVISCDMILFALEPQFVFVAFFVCRLCGHQIHGEIPGKVMWCI